MTTIIILLLISITSVLIIKSLSKKKDADYIQPNVKEKIEPTPTLIPNFPFIDTDKEPTTTPLPLIDSDEVAEMPTRPIPV